MMESRVSLFVESLGGCNSGGFIGLFAALSLFLFKKKEF